MSEKRIPVAERRKYIVRTSEEAKKIVLEYLMQNGIDEGGIKFGLPEVNDRYHGWKVPLIYADNNIGDIIVNAYTSEIEANLSSNLEIVQYRIKRIEAGELVKEKTQKRKSEKFIISNLPNLIIKGKSEVALRHLPEQSIDLVFTSPPYYNARKEYSEYVTYNDYLFAMRKVIRECRRVLISGKFFVINSSHILIPRANRNESSSRIAVPFDLHKIIIEEGFEFVGDIIWQKPEGAGWASGRGRRFSADRNPMQYKAVPVTEYVMVYRKKPCILIDHFIRDNPNPSIIQKSKIPDGYEKTNVWYISPARDSRHPAIFPSELAEKVIQYYSFVNDIVLDPFGGIGTTAKAAIKLQRRFCTIDISEEYIKATKSDIDRLRSLIEPISYEYLDYSSCKDDANYISLDYLINKLLNEGYTQEELYDILYHETTLR